MDRRMLACVIAGALAVGSPFINTAWAQVESSRVVQIFSFNVTPSNKLEPGTKLLFRVEGTPKSEAFLTLPGVTEPLRMKEVKPGIYEQAFTLDKSDTNLLDRFVNARADLKRGPNVTTATLKLGEPAVTPGMGQTGTPEDDKPRKPTE